MTDDDGGPRRPYNRPRRYPVQAPATDATDDDAAAPADVTRQNPTLAEAARQYGRRRTDVPRDAGADDRPATTASSEVPATEPGAGLPPGSRPYPGPYPSDPGPSGYPPGAPGQPTARTRTVPTRTLLLIAAAVLVVALVVGLIVGLSGDDDPRPAGAGPSTPSTPASSLTTVAPSTAPSSPTVAGGAPPATQVCAALGNTTPVDRFVAQPRPAERMPATYVEPQSGVKVAVCAGFFRRGAGAGRGRIAFLAEYERLAATQYALTLKTLGWTLVPNLPRTTYRNNLDTTVTLVQQGTSLVTVVGTGR